MRSLSGTSPSVTPTSLSSSSAERFSIQSPQVQEEFLKERLRRLESRSNVNGISSPSSTSSSSQASPLSPSSPQVSPFSPTPSVSPSTPWRSSPGQPDRVPALSLSSPELLSELKTARTQPLRHVPQRKGLTTVFSGRGRQVSGSSPEA
ncbi:DNA-directed RNA polymerase II subunit RPB1-like [Girardinichthys multiradiatus]|uniref:DNA-directed RNA polymerase II subunit RPB1-like n=1 Tax=Girardinichthys multiradiatus TaxID=208333 RepID=UPI001FABF56E|nr:DNA-directed RNA polymerase II subunit RPB1-like [Girardinichthys multiradiatus]